MKAGGLIAVALGMVIASPAMSDPLAPAAFRDRLAAAVATATTKPTVVVDDRTFRARRQDGTDLTISIDNAYAEYLRDPAKLDPVVARYATILIAAGASEEPIGALIVIVRPADYLQHALPPGASLANFVPGKPLAGDLAYFLAVDGPQSIRTVAKSDLARWGVDETGAWQRATTNLKAHIGTLAIVRLGSEDGAMGLGADSGLAPSVLADPGFCGTGKGEGMVALLYARDMILFANPEDRKGTDVFWRTVSQEVAAGRALSSSPIRCQHGHWQSASAPHS